MKKITKSDKRKMLLTAAGALALVVIVVIVSSIGKGLKNKQEEKLSGYGFSTAGFKGITNVECLNERVAVFTDSSGKKGIMSLDGKITQEAGNNEFYVVSDAWLSYKTAVRSDLSEYPLLVDEATGKISKKQYNKPDTPEKTAYWSEESGALCWYGPDGFIGKVSIADVALAPGLYPVARSDEPGAKFGYIDEALKIALDFQYDRAGVFSEGLAAVSQSGHWGYINPTGGVEVNFEYDTMGDGVYSFRNGLVPVTKNAKYGIIDRHGKVAVEFEFDKILQGRDGKYIANKDGKWGVLTVDEQIFAAANTTTQPQTRESAGNYRVSTKGGGLNLRSEPNTSSRIVTEIPNGAYLTVINIENGWAAVEYSASGRSLTGYVSENFIKPVTQEEPE